MRSAHAFRFRAVRPDGSFESGVVSAPDRRAAIAAVVARGVFPVDVAPHRGLLHRHRVTANDLALGLRALATLVQSGLPISRALEVLEEVAPPSWATAMPVIRQHIDEGKSLGDALRAAPLGLPPHSTSMITAGEAAGDAASATGAAAELLEKRAADIAAIRNALAYPALLAIAGGASVLMLVTVVLPRFVNILDDLGGSLPALTRAVLVAGVWAQNALLPGMVLCVTGAVLLNRWIATADGKLRWDGWVLRLPIIGSVRGGYAAGNVCATLGGLLRSGLPLSAALPLASRAAGNVAVSRALDHVARRLHRGDSFSQALHAESALTPTVVRLVRVGEESARLYAMVEHAGRIETARAFQNMERTIRLIEPILIILFGSVVMIVAASLLQAMYGIRPA